MSIGAASRGVLGLGSPAVIDDIFVFVPSKTFTLVPGIPSILDNDAIPVPSQTFTLTVTAPSINVGATIVAPSRTFIFTPNAPIVQASEQLLIPSVTFTLTTTPPVISDGAIISVPSRTFNFVINIPDILFDSKLLERTVNASETGEAYIILLTLQHPDLSDDVRISNDPTQLLPSAQVRGTISNGDEYIFLPFEFVFPNQEPDTTPRAQLRIDNVSREISTIIDSITSSPTIQIDVVLSSTPDIIELQLKDFRLQRTETNIAMVIGDITVEHFDQEPFPAGRFNPSSFPGLFAN